MRAPRNQKNNGEKCSFRRNSVSDKAEGLTGEVHRIKKVSDMLVSAHASLCDRYDRWALLTDAAILASSTWSIAVVFVEPRIGKTLTPFKVDPQLWIGLLSIITFFVSVLELRVDWRGRADAHKRTGEMYAEVKRDCGQLLASSGPISKETFEPILARYSLATSVGTKIKEREFLRQKRRHLRKVEISKYLSRHPFASIPLLRFKMWVRDNRSGAETHENHHSSSGL